MLSFTGVASLGRCRPCGLGKDGSRQPGSRRTASKVASSMRYGVACRAPAQPSAILGSPAPTMPRQPETAIMGLLMRPAGRPDNKRYLLGPLRCRTRSAGRHREEHLRRGNLETHGLHFRSAAAGSPRHKRSWH